MYFQKQIQIFKDKYRENYYNFRSFIKSLFKYCTHLFLVIIFFPIAIILLPLRIFFFKKNYKFINGFMDGTGHLVPEFDYFIQRNNDANKIILISRNKKKFNFITKIYKFNIILKNKFLIKFFDLFLFYYPKLVINVSFTKYNDQIVLNLFSKYYKLNYYFKYYNKYLILRKKNNSFYKLNFNKIFINDEIEKILNKKKVACIHIKEIIVNAVGEKIDPQTYLKCIEYLQDNNYQLIFIGREKFPEIFKKYNIFDYSNSNLTSLENDFLIVNKSSINIICGSGISYIPDTLDKKYLYINSWHISRPGGIGKKSLLVPALVKNKYTNNYLTFTNQASLENSGNMFFPQKINKKKYKIRNINDQELLDATIELVCDNDFQPNNNQLKFKKAISNYGWIRNSDAQICKSFVNKYEYLLN